MKTKEIREKSATDLVDAKNSAKQEIFNLRLQQKSGQIENPARLRLLRKDIARIATILGEQSRKKAAAAK